MPDLQDTQPQRRYNLRSHEPGSLRAPPRLLLWGVVLFFLLLLCSGLTVVVGFREILQPAQQQRVIDQLPFMRVLRQPTPAGGVFPTLEAAADSDAALALLDMPLAMGSPAAATATASPSPAIPATATAMPTPIPPSPTVLPPTATLPAPESTPVDSAQLPAASRISGLVHQQQTWNNCGPATITMALSYYGWTRNQAYAAARLKPNREDKNVSPQELAGFVQEETFVRAVVRIGGTLELLKRLIANDFPVIIETGAMFEAYDWIGHYRALVAYDDSLQLMYFFDSFLGVGDAVQGVQESYAQVDKDWQAFNRTFIVVYEPQREELLRTVLGMHWDERAAAQIAFERARAEARSAPQNGFAWLNMGASLVALGRYEEAAAAFDQANSLGSLPWRIYWYRFEVFEAYFEMGRYDDVLSLAQVNLNSAPELEESFYWRGRVYAAQGNVQRAADAFRSALRFKPNYAAARQALDSLN